MRLNFQDQIDYDLHRKLNKNDQENSHQESMVMT